MEYKAYLKGIALSVGIGILALFAGTMMPLASPILLGLIFGIIFGNFIKLPDTYGKGINYTSGKMLEFSLLFLALGINVSHIAGIGFGSFIAVILVVLSVLLISIFYTRRYNNGKANTYLVGFGTAICGSSAIAAVAPTIAKEKEDIGISLAVVNLMGTIGMLILPFLLNYLQINDLKSGLIIGGGLHSVANVAGAGFAINDETARIAITIKLARVALLSPALILYSYLIRKDMVSNWKEHFRLPWYVWSFMAISILASLIDVPEVAIKQSENIGKIILTIAMSAIGLKVSFKTLFQSGKKALLFGFLLFFVQVILLGIFSILI